MAPVTALRRLGHWGIRRAARTCHFGSGRSAIAAPRANVDSRFLDLHLQRSKAAVQFRVRRVVAEQIVRAQIVRDSLHAAIEIVIVHDSEAICVFRHRTHDLDPLLEHRLVD